MHRFLGGRYDPGPCPVDDTPHTACVPGPGTSAPLTSRTHIDQRVTVAYPRPGWLRAPAQAPEPVRTVSAPFTTGEYTRATHGPAIGKGKRGHK